MPAVRGREGWIDSDTLQEMPGRTQDPKNWPLSQDHGLRAIRLGTLEVQAVLEICTGLILTLKSPRSDRMVVF